MSSPSSAKRYKFTATIEAGGGGGAYVCFPFSTQEEFGSRGSVPVQATFDGVAYAGSLMPCAELILCSAS